MTIGSYQAKTHLPGLLDRVAKGEQITITKNGVPVAVLMPPPAAQALSPAAAIAELKNFRKGRKLGNISLRTMIEEGRRF